MEAYTLLRVLAVALNHGDENHTGHLSTHIPRRQAT
jgi:hypothetical protein